MPKPIFFHALNSTTEDNHFVSHSIAELKSVVLTEAPGVELHLSRLPLDLAAHILPSLHATHLNGAVDAVRRCAAISDIGAFGLYVYCPSDAPIAKAARKRLPRAAWGISISGVLSLSYGGHNKHILWHEALHLLGAQDHYTLGREGVTCELPQCLMQYAPDARTVGAGPMLCRQTLGMLRRI